MEVTVKLRGLISNELGFTEKVLELPDASNADDLLKLLGVEDEVSFTVDGAWRNADYLLKDGDVLWLYAQTILPGG